MSAKANPRILLDELPPPPVGQTGWPWTEAPEALPPMMGNDKPWPLVSIVTPSFNQGQYIEETIRSILLQGYPNLEYMVIDGGSNDGTLEIIKKYEQWLSHSISEPDQGQVDAINKGLNRASGEIFNWVNSDDFLLPGALCAIARAFENSDAVAASCINFSPTEPDELLVQCDLSAENLIMGNPTTIIHQPGLWLKTSKIKASGGLDDTLHYVFDWDLTIRYLSQAAYVTYLKQPVARFRLHEASKTVLSQPGFDRERMQVLQKLSENPMFPMLHPILNLRLRQFAWWESLDELRNRSDVLPVLLAIKIIALSVLDPKVRMTRLTFGAAIGMLTR